MHLYALLVYIWDKTSSVSSSLSVCDAGIVDHAAEPVLGPKLRRLLTAKAVPSAARPPLWLVFASGVWTACLSSCLFKFHLRELGTAPSSFILG